MRIGIVCFPTSGGSGVVATELTRALARRGHEVHLLSAERPFRARRDLGGARFHRVSIPDYPLRAYPSYGLAIACALCEATERFRLDVWHVHYAFPHAVSAYLARTLLPPPRPGLVVTLHGTDITLADQHPCHARMVRFALEESDQVTAVSRYLAAETQQRFRPRKVVTVVPNFVDPEVFAPRRSAALRRRFAPAGVPLLVHVSNFRPVKRVPDVVRAFARVRRRLPARLLLVGDGEDAPAVRRLVARLGLARDVAFAGEVERIERVLPAADLFLLASDMEGFGLSALEAMSCGVPVVSTRCGGPEEVVRDGVDGRLVPRRDPPALARACLDLLADPARRRACARAARARAREFDLESAALRYEELYRQVAHAAAVPAARRRAAGTGGRS